MVIRKIYNIGGVLLTLLFTCLGYSGQAQSCMPPGAVNAEGSSPGEYTLSATSFQEGVTAHYWYNSSGQRVTPTSSTPPGDSFFSSRLTKVFTKSETYEVSAVCNGVESARTTVTFTLNTTPQLKIVPSVFPEPDGVCADGFTLSAEGGSSYQWRKDDPNSTILSTQTVYSPSVSGKYYLTGKDSYGNWKTVSLSIVLIPNVGTPSIPLGISERCQASGTNSYSASANYAESYQWSLSNSSAGTISNTGQVTWSSSFSGETLVTVTAHGCGPSTSRSLKVTVAPINPDLEVTIGGSEVICVNGSLSLIANVSNAVGNLSYEWKKNDEIVSSSRVTEDFNLILDTVEDNDRIICSVTTDACVASAKVYSNEYVVQLKEGSTIGIVPSEFPDPDGVCAEGFTLTATGGKDYSWRKGSAGSSILGTGDVYIPNTSGDYFLTGINECGIYQTSKLPLVLIHTPGISQVKISGQQMICAGDEAVFQAEVDDSQEQVVYQWKKNDVDITVNESSDPAILILPAVQHGDKITCVVHSQNPCSSAELSAEYFVSVDDECGFNYIEKRQAKVEGKTDLFLNNDKWEIGASKDYFDGLGRTTQTIQRWATVKGHDIVTPVEYDEHGREPKKYLSYSSGNANGLYASNAIDHQHDFYQGASFVAHDNHPYSAIVYEPSPLNRIMEQGAPGENWQPVLGSPETGKTSKYNYEMNTTSDKVQNWDGQGDLPVSQGNFVNRVENGNTIAQLTKTITTDEEGHQVQEFMDKLGRMILKRVQAHENGEAEQWSDTYYAYDDFGNLKFVLPPMAIDKIAAGSSMDDPFLAKWVFCYKYDARKRMIEKRVPGSDWVYMVYDDRDRLVLTQDGNQRTNSEWTFTKYDQLNRPVGTGIYTHPVVLTQEQMQTYVNGRIGDEDDWYETYNGNNDLHGYTDQSFPKGVLKDDYLTITYYDNYGFKSLPDFGPTYDYDPGQLGTETCAQGTYTFPSTEFDRVKGQVTGSKVKVLDDNNTWLSVVTYYDDRYRVIQAITESSSGDISKYSTLYNFPGWVLATKNSYQHGTDTYEIKKRYTYDHAGRLMQGYHELIENGSGQGEILLAENKYNELGELIEKNLHVENGTPHQSIDYRYNIRGWLESVNNSTLQIEPGRNIDDANPDLFGMELFYNHLLNGVDAGN